MMASYQEGYDDERFESPVPENLHCDICLNVLRKPMQCVRNEHSFCKPCITRHLQETSQTCPNCIEPLTLETLRPSRLVTDLLSQLRIRCDNSHKGCGESVRLEVLEGHVATCEFTSVQCSNDGCEVIINRRDQLNHEMNDCNFRLVKCEVCGKNVAFGKRMLHCYVTRNEMERKIDGMSSMMVNMSREVSKLTRLVGDMKTQMDDVSKRLNGLERVVQENKKGEQPGKQESPITHVHPLDSQSPCSKQNSDNKKDIIIAGGRTLKSYSLKSLKSVEMFSWPTRQWTLFPPMTSERWFSSSFLHEGQMFVCGGRGSDTIETLELKEEEGEWKEFQGKLPQETWGHENTIYEENLFIFGGRSGLEVVNDIYKVSLTSHSSQLVSHLPEPRFGHSAQRFGDKVAIVGGTTTGGCSGSLDSVVLYDIKRNCCRTLAPLPFAVCGMATVAWRDNIIIIGGLDKNDNVLNTVVSYNITNENSKMLPLMKHKRSDCSAVVTGNVIVVMGGRNEESRDLNSVEIFSFDNYSWEELPPMNDRRSGATAVVNIL